MRKTYGEAETDDFGEIVTFNTENISDAVPITEEELKCLISLLEDLREENDQLLNVLNEEKVPYLFTSKDLVRLVATTESLKTKINLIAIVGPRLTDPRGESDYLIGLFKYAKHKDQVKEILKARAQILNAAMFNKGSNILAQLTIEKATPSSSPLALGGRSGSGGRGSGRGGRGRGRGTPDSSRISQSNPGTPRATSSNSHTLANGATLELSKDDLSETSSTISPIKMPDLSSPEKPDNPTPIEVAPVKNVPPAKSLDSGLMSAETQKQFPVNAYRSTATEKTISADAHAKLQRSLSRSISDDIGNGPPGPRPQSQSLGSGSSSGSGSGMQRRNSRIMKALHPEALHTAAEYESGIETKSWQDSPPNNNTQKTQLRSSINISIDSTATDDTNGKDTVEVISITNKSGFLKKKARNNCIRNWHTRYFELSYGKLAYYHSKEEAKDENKKVGDFSLAYASIKEQPPAKLDHGNSSGANSEGAPTTVCVVFGSGEKDLELDAQSRNKAAEWAKAIKEHSAYASGRAVSIV